MSGHENLLLSCMTCTDLIAQVRQVRKLTQASQALNPLTEIGRFDCRTEPYSERKDLKDRTETVDV